MGTNSISLRNLSKLTKEICKVEVENAKLTAQYYNQYLGFEIIGVNDSSTFYLVRLNEYLLYIVNANGNEQSRRIDVVINSFQIENFYYTISSRTKVFKPLNYTLDEGIFFSIIDCNGNIVNFSCEKH
jgi:hypothetical protein